MARVRRSWTSKEDELLRKAVMAAEQQHQPLRWRELAKAVPGRSNKDCRRRWWNSLADGRTMGLWSENEDERLIAAIQRWGTNWTKVAAEVGSRSADQCSSHWNHVLDPKINYCDWTPEEDADLLHEVLTNGTKWAQIASYHTPTRTTLALKNRYSTLRVKNENRSRTRQSHPSPSSGHATLQSIHIQPSLRNSEGASISNSSDNSESMRYDDVEEEEEEREPVKENVKVIRTWLEDVSSDMDIQNDGGMNTRQVPSGPSGTTPVRMEGINVSIPDNTAWYDYPKESVLPTPDMNDGSGIAMDDYLQLDPVLLRGQATEPPFNLPAGCFFEQEEPSPQKRNASHLLHGLSTVNQPLLDTTGCTQPTHATSLEESNKAPECNDWVMGNKTSSVSKSTPSFPSLAPQDGTPPKSTKFRVSITLTCDEAQLALALTQLSVFGTALSINVEKHN